MLGKWELLKMSKMSFSHPLFTDIKQPIRTFILWICPTPKFYVPKVTCERDPWRKSIVDGRKKKRSWFTTATLNGLHEPFFLLL
ncbi:hypothetical protein GDO78_015154 [Eleutherodactylus coqui]|uniref:Uncharacterized protein n=1 Tax=Eleutherodactylus coqui TaxID=57060 RepID=A0A8J6BGA5_ELECQ|nr:hypothetical protein GDO78_015154 [Eleutherodactylus coqui]